MEKPQLTEKDFENTARRLRCGVADIKTVAEVESKGKAFYADGFPVILFERHKFHKFTKGKFDKSHPDISNPEAGGYGPSGQHQRDRFNLAFSLDPIAAMMSCSWGRFQLMGFNYKLCGFASVGEFVDAMKQSEQAQLDAFAQFIISTGLSDELRNHKWTALAEGYNGLNQKKNNYDKKLAAAYRKFQNSAAVPAKAEPAKDDQSEDPGKPSDQPSDVDQGDTPTGENEPLPDNSAPQAVETKTQETIKEDTPTGTKETSSQSTTFQSETKDMSAPEKEGSTKTVVTTAGIGWTLAAAPALIWGFVKSSYEQGQIDVKQIFDVMLKFFSENTRYIFYTILAVIGFLALKKVFKQLTFLVQMVINAIPWLHDIRIVGKDPAKPNNS